MAFRRFNAAALLAYWESYARDTTYNLTARNCSSTVARLLDAAMEGSLDDGRPCPGHEHGAAVMIALTVAAQRGVPTHG